MNQLFLQLVQSVTGNVITIVALEIVAAIIGFIVAWLYAKSVFTPVIKGLEADKAGLQKQVEKLTGEYGTLNEKVDKLGKKITQLEKEVSEKDSELKKLSVPSGHTGKYVVGSTKGGGNHFNLKATNGQVILTSLMFPSLDECNKGIEAVREFCTDDSRFERKLSTNNKNYFNLTAPDGHVLGKSELYESLAGMENGIASVKKNGISTVVEEE
ncbi:MAG: DUF1508 domain-containing protein [Bacteroidales bacterium]|nr:DUF1508 domain-containing protein [Bacteroidales bacterium]